MQGLDGDRRLLVDTTAGPKTLAADKILVTVGRRPLTQGWGLEEMALDMTGPFIKVDDQCRTAMRDVWAIGDLVGEPMLAHKAMAQGAMVAEIIAGKRRRFDPAGVAAIGGATALSELLAGCSNKAAPGAAPVSKECPACQMTIPIKATRCPHCTSEIATTSRA